MALFLFFGGVGYLQCKPSLKDKKGFIQPFLFVICVWQPLGEAVVGKEMAAKITFTNPLPRMLKDVVFRVEGLGLQKGHEVIVG